MKPKESAGPRGPQGSQGIVRDGLGLVPKPTDTEWEVIRFFGAANKIRQGLSVECPFCQAAMVVRLRRTDERAFLGCTRYPQCSGSFDIPEKAQCEAKQWERQMMTPDHTPAFLPGSQDRPWDDDDMFTAKDEDFNSLIDETLSKRMPPGTRGTVEEAEGKSPGLEIRGDSVYAGGQEIARIVADSLTGSSVMMAEAALGKKGTPMKEEEDEASNGLKARLARSAKKAPYRVARMRALSEGKKAIMTALKPRVQPASLDLIEAFLDTDAGQGAILGLVGLAGPYAPKIGKNKHVQVVCEEFLDEGVAKGANEVFGLLGAVLEPVLKSIMSSLPEVSEIADKVVPKRRKKRVATSDVRVKAVDEPEAEEEEEPAPRPKNALRAIRS